jgi:hypothetical protein
MERLFARRAEFRKPDVGLPVAILREAQRFSAIVGIARLINCRERGDHNVKFSFRFRDETLNRRLISLIKQSQAHCSVDSRGVVRYAADDVDLIENEIISRVRTSVFPRWQIICCPSEWAESYKQYMLAHGIPHVEELSDRERCFLVPRKFRPHAWKLNEPRRPAAQKQVG